MEDYTFEEWRQVDGKWPPQLAAKRIGRDLAAGRPTVELALPSPEQMEAYASIAAYDPATQTWRCSIADYLSNTGGVQTLAKRAPSLDEADKWKNRLERAFKRASQIEVSPFADDTALAAKSDLDAGLPVVWLKGTEDAEVAARHLGGYFSEERGMWCCSLSDYEQFAKYAVAEPTEHEAAVWSEAHHTKWSAPSPESIGGPSPRQVALFVPQPDAGKAAALGAVWDSERKCWACSAAELHRFSQWAEPTARWRQRPPQPPAPDPQRFAPMDERVYLSVPFQERNAAKEAGARWDAAERAWYADGGADLAPLGVWLPADHPQRSQRPQQLFVPFEEKDAAKAAGAVFDPAAKAWFIPLGNDPDRFAAWSHPRPKEEGASAKPDSRTYLNLLGKAERDAAKAAGARYDPAEKRFYFEATKVPPEMEGFVRPVAKLYLTVPYEDRAEAKAAGAAWDPAAKSWYVRSGSDMAPFEKWTVRSEQTLEAARERLKPKDTAQTQGVGAPMPEDAGVPSEISEGAPWDISGEEGRDADRPPRRRDDPHADDLEGWGAPDRQEAFRPGTGGDVRRDPCARRYLYVPFGGDGEEAKRLGADYDPKSRRFWIPASADPAPFGKWLKPARKSMDKQMDRGNKSPAMGRSLPAPDASPCNTRAR